MGGGWPRISLIIRLSQPQAGDSAWLAWAEPGKKLKCQCLADFQLQFCCPVPCRYNSLASPFANFVHGSSRKNFCVQFLKHIHLQTFYCRTWFHLRFFENSKSSSLQDGTTLHPKTHQGRAFSLIGSPVKSPIREHSSITSEG